MRIGLAAAAAVFFCCWVLLDHSFYARDRLVDTHIYQAYGIAIRDGQLPYRDFSVEYPPGALPTFIAPTYAGNENDYFTYEKWFARMMGAFGLCCLGFVALARPPRTAVAFVAISPLLIGSLALSRYDLWPTALVAAAVAAFVRERHRLGWLALGLAFAAKLFPVVLLPLAGVWTLRRRGARELGAGVAIWLAVVVATFAPFAALAPHGLWESVWGQVSRPVQIESLVATFLTTFGHPRVVGSHNSFGIAGHETLGAISTAIEIAALAGLWFAFARGTVDRDRFVRYGAACVCAFIAFGKVLSPQYLIWLVPLVPLVRGSRGLVATGVLAAALIDTLVWFPARYPAYVSEFKLAWLVLLRDLLLVALLLVLSLPAPARGGAWFGRSRARAAPTG